MLLPVSLLVLVLTFDIGSQLSLVQHRLGFTLTIVVELTIRIISNDACISWLFLFKNSYYRYKYDFRCYTNIDMSSFKVKAILGKFA